MKKEFVSGCKQTKEGLYDAEAITDFGNGVYYFECEGEVFGSTLSAFIGNHPELEVVSIAGDDAYNHGRTIGYFVVFKRHIEATA
ncbi:hypothetical protein M0R01_01770 [bacterium]|nr:hypothetical protein [bacterium]